MTNKRALVTGVTGQDGSFLTKLLLDKGYEVFGTYRRLSSPNFWRLQYLNIYHKINLIPMDLGDSFSIANCIKIAKPDEVYHLAAQSFVDTSFIIPETTANYVGLGTTRFLEAIKSFGTNCKFYFAGSSEMYGETGKQIKMLNEKSPFAPRSPYAIAKLHGYWTTCLYRTAYKMFTVNGILFNHESPLRGIEFVTRKITNEVAKILIGESKGLKLGNLYASRDWGFAPDYVEAMWQMLQQDEPSDYVIATGESHTVLEFVELAFKAVGMNYKDHVQVDERLQRPAEVDTLCGDSGLAHSEFGWKPNVNFSKLVSIMVEEDVKRWKRWINGEKFPWDAFNYPSEERIMRR